MEFPECCCIKAYYDDTRKYYFTLELVAAKVRQIEKNGNGITKYPWFRREVCRMVLNDVLSEQDRETVLVFLQEKESFIQNMYLCMSAEEISQEKCCFSQKHDPDLNIFNAGILEKAITKTAADLGEMFEKDTQC